MRCRIGVALLVSALPLVAADSPEFCYFKAGNPIPWSTVICAREVPKGDWRVFTRDGDRRVSDRVVASGVEAPLVAAAKIDARVPEGASLFVYIPRTRSIMPVVSGMIPSDTDVVPIAAAAGKIAAVGAPINVHPGATAKAQFPGANVVAIVAARAGSDTSVAPPDVFVQSGERRIKPVDPLRATDTAPALLFFRDVPAAGSKLVLSGKRWKTAEVPIAVTGDIALLDPITATQTSKVEVSWWAPVDPAKLATKQSDCTISKRAFPFYEKRSTEPKFVAILMACPSGPRSCKESAREEVPMGALRGSFAFEDVPAGLSVLEFDYPGLPAVSKSFEVFARESTAVDVPLHYIAFYGKVTRGGKPVHAMVFGAITDPATGEYNAVVTRLPPARITTEVLPCDGGNSYRFVPDETPKENTAFDIEIPDNRIVVEVYDKASGAPVPRARVDLAALMPGETNGAHFAGAVAETDENGKASIGPVLQNRNLKVCATRDDYEPACEPDFKMEQSEKTIRLVLSKAHVHRGHVAGGAGRMPQIVWFSPATGMITEMIRAFQEDGWFTFKKEHPPGEIVVAIAADRPLYALLQPMLDPEATFEIARPLAPVRSFTVTLAEGSKEESAWPALAIGNVIVPANAVMWHLGPRLHAVGPLRPGRSVMISDVLQTGPIKVILVPRSAEGRYSPQVQLPLVPDVAAFPMQDLGTATSVVFP